MWSRGETWCNYIDNSLVAVSDLTVVFSTVKKGQTPNLPEPALVFVDWGEAVSVDGVEVVLVRDAWGDDFRVHYVALASGAALMQRLEAGREVEVDG